MLTSFQIKLYHKNTTIATILQNTKEGGTKATLLNVILIIPLPRKRPYQVRIRGKRSLRERLPKPFRARFRYRDHQVRGHIHIHKGKRIS